MCELSSWSGNAINGHRSRYCSEHTSVIICSQVNQRAGVAQLVEYKLPKLGVAGSNPVARSSSLSKPTLIYTLAEQGGPGGNI